MIWELTALALYLLGAVATWGEIGVKDRREKPWACLALVAAWPPIQLAVIVILLIPPLRRHFMSKAK